MFTAGSGFVYRSLPGRVLKVLGGPPSKKLLNSKQGRRHQSCSNTHASATVRGPAGGDGAGTNIHMRLKHATSLPGRVGGSVPDRSRDMAVRCGSPKEA